MHYKMTDFDYEYERYLATPDNVKQVLNYYGVAIINNKKATLHIHCPNKYKVPMAGVLDKHIHYRIALVDSPILTDVRTTYIKC